MSDVPALSIYGRLSSETCAGLSSPLEQPMLGCHSVPANACQLGGLVGFYSARHRLGRKRRAPGMEDLLWWTSSTCLSRMRKLEFICHPWISHT